MGLYAIQWDKVKQVEHFFFLFKVILSEFAKKNFSTKNPHQCLSRWWCCYCLCTNPLPCKLSTTIARKILLVCGLQVQSQALQIRCSHFQPLFSVATNFPLPVGCFLYNELVEILLAYHQCQRGLVTKVALSLYPCYLNLAESGGLQNWVWLTFSLEPWQWSDKSDNINLFHGQGSFTT